MANVRGCRISGLPPLLFSVYVYRHRRSCGGVSSSVRYDPQGNDATLGCGARKLRKTQGGEVTPKVTRNTPPRSNALGYTNEEGGGIIVIPRNGLYSRLYTLRFTSRGGVLGFKAPVLFSCYTSIS